MMMISQGEKFYSNFITYFLVIPTKTNTSLVLTLSLSIYDKTVAKKPKSLFWTFNQTFAIRSFLASYNVCPMAIPEICAQTQGSNYWQLIHSKKRS